jgi:hypothetical protein
MKALTRFLWLAASIPAIYAGCSSSQAPAPSSSDTDAGTGEPSREPILDGGGDVPSSPNGEQLCPQGACNYQTASGCAPATPSCVPLPDGKGSVAPACESTGTVPFGGTCTQWTDCQAGAVCADGKCSKLCCGKDWTGCPDGQHCLSAFNVQVAPGKDVASQAYLCTPVNKCDALVPSSCTQAGKTCQLADPTGATACLPEGTGLPGEPCPCKGGYACVGDGCRRLCKAVAGGGEPSCPAVEGRCVHFNRDPEGVGECTPD